MSGTQVSSWGDPNILYKALSGQGAREQQALEDTHVNALLNQQTTQANLNTLDLEMIARASAYLNTLPEDQRATAYPGIVSQLQQSGFAKNAPSIYPGHERIAQLASMGTPSKELMTIAENRRFAQSQQPTGSTGTGTGAAPGAAAPAADSYETAIGGHEGTGRNPRSTAYGTGQFLESTWLNFAAANPEMFPNMSQQQILAARSNPALGNAAINWLAQRNAADLQAAGVTPSGQSLGISHYLGSGAAAKIMQAADTEPVRNFVSEAAVRANPELANMTVGQMKQRYAGTPNPSFMAATTTTTPAGDGRYTVASTVPVPPPTGGTGGVVAGTGAPAVPAAPAATTAAVPGATPAPAPAAPAAAVPGLLQLGADGLTDQQRRQNAALFATGRVSPADQVELQQKQAQQNFTHNNTVETAARAARGEARQEDTAARTAANEAERIRLAREDARRADAKAAREEADAAQKAKLAGLPYQGSAIEAQDANILLGGDDGSARYAGAYARAAAPRVNADGSSVTPNMVAYDKPTWRGGKGQVSEDGAPDYSTPKTTPPTIMNTEQSRIGAFADSLIRSNPVINETEDAAVTWAQRARTKAGDFVGFNINSPEAQKFRAAKERFLNGVLRPESGAAVHDDEWVRAERIYFPMPGDDASTIELKRKFREAKIAETVKQAGPAYKPPPAATSIRPPITSFDK